MADNQQDIDQLLHRLDVLLKKQEDFSREVNEIKTELTLLKGVQPGESAIVPLEKVKPFTAEAFELIKGGDAKEARPTPPPKPFITPKVKADLEKFIGENLINKIGIAITVIGVGIGAKYSIEHDLISPLTRIILGYLAGIGLLGFGVKLKAKYENYSSVLVSGAMAIMYFITFAGYSFYQLFPQGVAFALMLIFTAFTVVAALSYAKEVIALIGLVGAYAVPLLLRDGSGQIGVFFSYMAIINVGILVISIKKYWKLLFYTSFALTWGALLSWYFINYEQEQHFWLALTFLTVFFVIFYFTFLAYKVVKTEKFVKGDIVLLLLNSFLFYGTVYDLLSHHETGAQLLGLFTLGNAVIHFVVSLIVYKRRLADKNLFYLASGLVLVFLSIAVPVQLDGNWVTLLWVGEAALVFWIGRAKQVETYEKLAYPLMLLAFFSIMHDWSTVYNYYRADTDAASNTPIFNINFLTSLLFIAAFTFINALNRNPAYKAALDPRKNLAKIINIAIPSVLLLAIYNAFRLEIANYWDLLDIDVMYKIREIDSEYPDYRPSYDLQRFKTIWLINYTMVFAALLSLVNTIKLKNKKLGLVSLGLTVLAISIFLLQGLYELGQLRDSYITQGTDDDYTVGIMHVVLRYISFACLALALLSCYRHVAQPNKKIDLKVGFSLFLHTTFLWVASSELINWLNFTTSSHSYKLGISILWGSYALLLIALGIWKKKKHLRIGAIVLFGVTLIKLFFYDISALDTIAKTIVFVALGVLLLIISFLYNKYKHIISNDPEA